MHSDHQYCRLQRILAIHSQLIQSLHHLRLFHDHQLPLRKHRIATRRCDHRISIHISTVAHSLIEIPLALINTMLQDRIAHHIDIIRLISHQKINRLEDAVLSILHNLSTQRICLYKTFCHNHTKIIRFL